MAHLKQDALSVYEYVTGELGVAPEHLIVHGHSLGTFVATYLANEHPVGGVVLENPATNVDAWSKALLPWYLRLFIGFDFAEPLREEDNLTRVCADRRTAACFEAAPKIPSHRPRNGEGPSRSRPGRMESTGSCGRRLVTTDCTAATLRKTAYRALLAEVMQRPAETRRGAHAVRGLPSLVP